MSVRRVGAITGLMLLFLFAVLLRVTGLGDRPVHADEAVHLVKLRELWEHGSYRYDPNEHHGPTLYDLALPLLKLRGVTDYVQSEIADYRLAPALAGSAVVLVTALFADGLGWLAVLLAAAFVAVSPSLTFYSRSFIQEPLLVLFSALLVGALWRGMSSRRMGWWLLCGFSAGLMIATKETAAIVLAAVGLAIAATRDTGSPGATGGLPTSAAPGSPGALVDKPPVAPGRVLLAAVGLMLLTAWLLLSNLGQHPVALLDFARSFVPWGHRAGESDLHLHPWWYYLELLGWAQRGGGVVRTELLLLGLALVGIVSAFRGERPLPRFLTLYALLLLVIYSAIPYKTPWCVSGLTWGFAMLAGVGAAELLSHGPSWRRGLLGVLLLVGLVQLAWQAVQTSWRWEVDNRNPYAYAQTAPDVLDLADQLDRVQRASPDGAQTIVQVVADDTYCWPLPWYLRGFDRVGYYTQPPADLVAPVILLSATWSEQLGPSLEAAYEAAGYHALRGDCVFELWIEKGLWDRFLATPAAE